MGGMGSWKNSFDRASYQTVLIVKTLSNQNYWCIFLRKEKLCIGQGIKVTTFIDNRNPGTKLRLSVTPKKATLHQ